MHCNWSLRAGRAGTVSGRAGTVSGRPAQHRYVGRRSKAGTAGLAGRQTDPPGTVQWEEQGGAWMGETGRVGHVGVTSEEQGGRDREELNRGRV